MNNKQFIHKSWKRIEILKYIMDIGIDCRGYCYLTKNDLVFKISNYIYTNEIKDLYFLFKIKPTRHIPYQTKQLITKKARKVINYCKLLDLEFAEYSDISQVKIDVETIKTYGDIPSVKQAIILWNEIAKEQIEYEVKNEYNMSIKQEQLIRQKLLGLKVKKGNFLIEFN